MDFVGAIKAGFLNYVNFRGTATRPEFWYWFLFTTLVGIVTSALEATGNIATAFSLATFLPTLSVTVRRLRDAGFSWVWLLMPLPFVVPFTIGLYQIIVVLVELGIDPMILQNLETIDAPTMQLIGSTDAILGPSILAFVSLVCLVMASLVVNLLLEILPGKSFEQGNKRVAPKGPEYPVL